jgi:2-polyprenyl-3-methyl-5-hydroxy-6-metoxy-1,4-benzoquinol methylase
MSLTIMPDVAHSATDFDLSDERLSALWNAENKHFWHEARSAWILSALDHYLRHRSASILDVGCGSGGAARSLVKAGYDVTGIDTAEVLVRRAHLRLPGARFICGELSRLPEEFAGPYDVIAFFDVLEHLDWPELLLQSALRFARSGALVIVTVPAQMSLFSDVDTASGHKRRYEQNELSELLIRVGLKKTHEHGIFRILSIPLKMRPKSARSELRHELASNRAWANEVLLQDFRVPPVLINKCARLACAIERCFFSRSEGVSGPSILAVGTVP